MKYIKKKLINSSISETLDNSDLTKLIQKYRELLSIVTVKLDPKDAKDKLKIHTEQIILIARKYPQRIDYINLVFSLPTASLEARKWAFRVLNNSNINKIKVPLAVKIFNDWDRLKTNMSLMLQHFVQTAFQNMFLSNLSIINGFKKKEMNLKHNPSNTVVIYIQPRFFALNSPQTRVPHKNSRDFFETVLEVLSNNKVNVLPLLLPYTNLMPEDEQFRDFVKIGHHTYGVQHKTLHHKIAYLEEYSYLDEGGFGPFSKKLSDTGELDIIKSIEVGKAENFHNKLHQKYCQSKVSKFDQPQNELFLEDGRNYYFFSMQTVNDTVMRKAFLDQYSAILLILKEFNNTQKTLLVKRHPLDYTKETQIFLNRIKSHPNCNVLDNNIHDLISASEATICINSGVGIEALLHLKPVFTIGESDYSSATTVIKSKNELSFHMRAKIKKLDVNFIKQFLYFFFNIHLYKNDDSIRILSAIKKAQNDIKKL